MMLALSTMSTQDESQSQMESFSIRTEGSVDFSDGNILESINFDDIFLDISDGDVLPDLEMDPEILADFSPYDAGEESEMTPYASMEIAANKSTAPVADGAGNKDQYEEKSSSPASAGSACLNSMSSLGEELVIERDESTGVKTSQKESDRGKKLSAQSKNSQGKRKVEWTPELHKRFVQAVEQLGVYKAVPSRILEIMGIDCLTRHNIASHLQKYRSHRKHMMAREAEAASWNQKRQMCGVAGFPANGDKTVEANPWLAPTMGFPPMGPMHQFRPLHVWGHPTMDQSLTQVWPKHLAQSPPPPLPQPAWVPPVAPPNTPQPHDISSHWHAHRHQAPRPTTLTPVAVWFPPPLATSVQRFGSPPVPGIPPHHAMYYKVNRGIGVPTGQTGPRPLLDFHPSKESIDAALGDILSKPWLPLPIGLKPPAIDSVMGELMRQGVPNIPSSCV